MGLQSTHRSSVHLRDVFSRGAALCTMPVRLLTLDRNGLVRPRAGRKCLLRSAVFDGVVGLSRGSGNPIWHTFFR